MAKVGIERVFPILPLSLLIIVAMAMSTLNSRYDYGDEHGDDDDDNWPIKNKKLSPLSLLNIFVMAVIMIIMILMLRIVILMMIIMVLTEVVI